MTDTGGHGMIVSIIIAYMAIMVDSIFIILVGILRIICFDFQINSYMPPSKDEIKKHWKVRAFCVSKVLLKIMFTNIVQ